MLTAEEKRSPQVYKSGTVEAKGLDRGPAFDCEADNPGEVVAPNEVVAPEITTRVEEGYHRCRHRIDSLDLRVLMIVTTLTGEGQILQVTASSGLDGCDVLDRERLGREGLLAAAVFAEPAGAGPYSFSSRAPLESITHSERAGFPVPPSGPQAVCHGDLRAPRGARSVQLAAVPPRPSDPIAPDTLLGRESPPGTGSPVPDTAGPPWPAGSC